MTTPQSTKISIAFAKNGSRAVILRQGPSKWTRMLAWCTRTGHLEPGQWVHSKVPFFAINSDASLVLTFIQDYRRRHDYSTWVALSRPPSGSDFVFTRGGKVSIVKLGQGRAVVEDLFDLSTMEPEPIEAPSAATKW